MTESTPPRPDAGQPAHRPQALETFDPFDPALAQCPFPTYAAMRTTEPVFHLNGTDLYFVTRRDLIVQIVRDTATFSSRFGQTAESPPPDVVERIAAIRHEGWPQVPTIANEDPPLHDQVTSWPEVAP